MRKFYVCLCLFALVLELTPADSQAQSTPQKTGQQKSRGKDSNKPANQGGPTNQAATDQKAKDQKTATFNNRLAKIFDPANVDLSDYVPCHFTASELLQLRPTQPTPRLTGSEAESLKTQVIAEAVAQEQAGTLDHDSVVQFAESVANANLEGLTPSAALAAVIALLRAADKLGQARKNPASILSLYRDNLLQGLKILARESPNYGPIGTDWAEGLTQQLFNDGVSRATKRGLDEEEAKSIFNGYQDAAFRDELAKAGPRDALQKIKEKNNEFNGDENEDVAHWSELKEKKDKGVYQASVDNARKEVEQENSRVAAAQGELEASTARETVAQRQLDTVQDIWLQVEKSAAIFVADPQKMQAMENERNKAKANLDAVKNAKDAASKEKTDAQTKLEASKGTLNISIANLQKATDDQNKANAADKELQNAQKSVAAVVDQKNNIDQPAQAGAPGSAGQAIVDQARSTIQAFKRPPDIGCAMSILSWNETRYEYGRLLASEYIAVQVVVRNLSETQEFVLHDSAFAVDTDLTGRKGRFFSGRDKLILRGMSVADADFSPRNLLVHMMESVGTIMSAVIPVAGEAFGNASSVYNSGFLQGVHRTWADHNTDHLNLLNDTAFSSATAYKTVVPKSGSVMFVMFIPSKQFEQGWWTQACAQTISNGILVNSPDPDGSAAEKRNRQGMNNLPELDSGSSHTRIEDEIGIDLQRARTACGLGGRNPSAFETANGDIDQDAANMPVSTAAPTVFNRVPYKKWSPNALAIFREIAFTIVAGVHVNEASQNNPVITTIDNCENDQGNVDFGKQSGGILSCAVKGQNLDKVQKVRLHNATDATDAKVAEGDVKVNGDSTSATASLPLSQIGPLEGRAYRSFPVDKNGVEGAVGPTLHFDNAPFIDSLTTTPIKIDLSKDLDAKTLTKTIDLLGYHLDKLAGVHLAGKNTSSEIKFDFGVEGKPTTGKASFIFGPAKDDKDGKAFAEQLNKAGKPLELIVTLNSTDKVVPTITTSTVIEISGTISAAPTKPDVPVNNEGATGNGGEKAVTKPTKRQAGGSRKPTAPPN